MGALLEEANFIQLRRNWCRFPILFRNAARRHQVLATTTDVCDEGLVEGRNVDLMQVHRCSIVQAHCVGELVRQLGETQWFDGHRLCNSQSLNTRIEQLEN